MTAKYRKGFVQRDSVEREEYAKVPSASPGEGKERDGAENLLERILDRNNLNRAYKQVKGNHGAPGIDRMTVEQALPWLQEHRAELLQSIREGKYTPSPVRRKEIPQTRWRCAQAGYPNGGRPNHPASHCPTDTANL